MENAIPFHTQYLSAIQRVSRYLSTITQFEGQLKAYAAKCTCTKGDRDIKNQLERVVRGFQRIDIINHKMTGVSHNRTTRLILPDPQHDVCHRPCTNILIFDNHIADFFF